MNTIERLLDSVDLQSKFSEKDKRERAQDRTSHTKEDHTLMIL